MTEYQDEYSFDDKPKRKNSEDPTTWTQAWQAIAVFLVLVLIMGFVANFIQNIVLGDRVSEYMELLTTGNYSANPFASMMPAYMSSPLMIALALVISLVFWIIGLFVVYGLSHFFAMRLGGTGTMRGLIVRANVWMIISYILFMIASTIIGIMTVNNVLDYAATVDINSNAATFQNFNNYVLNQVQMSSFITVAIWLLWGIGLSNIIGKYYQFGQTRGCGTVILLNVSVFAVYCGIVIALGAALFSAMQQ